MQCGVPIPATGIADGSVPTVARGSDQDDDLMVMINKLTEEWDRNEVVSIRIPVVLEDVAVNIEQPDFPMHLFFGFNYTTVFRHGVRGALGLPRRTGMKVAIELLTTRAIAGQWATKTNVPPTDLVRTLPPGTTPADVRSEIQTWFQMYSPTEAEDWTRKDSHGTLVAEALRYELTVYTYTPAIPTTDNTASRSGPSGGQQDANTAQAVQATNPDRRPDEPARDERPAPRHDANETATAGTWDDIHAVWTKDRDRTWDDLQPVDTAQEPHGPEDAGQPRQRQGTVPEWASPGKTAATGPQPAVTLFRPRDKMAICCEKKCSWCDEQCYQARNFRYAGHMGRCLCQKHTQMALAQTAKKYICNSTDHREEVTSDNRRTQPAYQKWTDWSTRYWTPSHAETRSQNWYSSGWKNTQWRYDHVREGEHEREHGTGRTENNTDKGNDTKQDEAQPNTPDNQHSDIIPTGAKDQSGVAPIHDKNDSPSGPTPAQGKAEASGSHERDEQQGKGWEEDRWKNKRYYYAVEVTDKEDKEPNPWARAGHMIEEEADRTTEDVGSLAQPTLAGIADSKVTAAVAQADETKGSQVKTILEPDGHDQQEPRIDPARDGERKEEEGRPRDAGHSVARTEEMESRSNKKGFMAVAPPPHQPAAARHKPADRSKRTRSTSITTVTNLTHRSPKQDSRRPTTDRRPHRRIGEASNPGPPRQVAARTHREGAVDYDQPRCTRCDSRWQTSASRALQTDNTPYTACGVRGPQPDATEQSVRPTLLHFICTTCAWHCCPGCAGVLQCTPTQELTGLNETGTPMTDQAKRKRSTTPEVQSRRNTPGPSTKLGRRAQTEHTRAGDESYSDESSTSEVHLPDSVRRILDFEQWAGSTSTSSSEEDTEEPPRSIPLLPYSEPDVPTPTGAYFTEFSIQTCSPTAESPFPTQPVRGKAASEGAATGSGTATPQITPRRAGRAHSPGDDELTDGYITDTDRDERVKTGPTQQE